MIPERKWPAPRAAAPRPGETILAPTKSSRERMDSFKADTEVTEQIYQEIVAADQMGILVSLEKKPERALHKYYALMEDLAHRCKLSQQSDVEQRPPTVGELGLLLLAGSDPRMPKPYSVENTSVSRETFDTKPSDIFAEDLHDTSNRDDRTSIDFFLEAAKRVAPQSCIRRKGFAAVLDLLCSERTTDLASPKPVHNQVSRETVEKSLDWTTRLSSHLIRAEPAG